MAKTKVMIVEDEFIVGREIQAALEDMGYAADPPLATGEGALERAGEERPNLVLMDIRLGGRLNGIDTADLFRSRFKLPVVYLTAYADDELVRQAKQTEPYGYLLKPVRNEELKATIEITLQKVGLEGPDEPEASAFERAAGVKGSRALPRVDQDKCHAVLTALKEGMSVVSPLGLIEEQNEILSERFGPGIGRKCHRVYFGQDAPCGSCPMKEALAEWESKRIEARAVDGKNYELTLSPFLDSEGRSRILILAVDVTEMKLLQVEAMRTGHLASLGELAAGVAHEINNPVNGIINYAQILSDALADRGEEAEIPGLIIKEGRRVAAIVQNLLSFARPHKERTIPASLREILSDALSLMERQLLKDGIRLELRFPPDLPRIVINRHQIQQVFVNLISNARYALNQKERGLSRDKVLKISGGKAEEGGREFLRVAFHDNGIGIPENILPQVCDPFFSTKPQGKGTGLGLSISHGIVRDHGGRLWLESEEGSHTRALMDLPLHPGGTGEELG